MNNDLISREDLKVHISELMLVYSGTELDNAILNAIDNAPTVEPFERIGSICEENCGYRPQGELANEVWKLYKKHQSHLATHVLEFGDELKELLNKYQKGGAE